MFQGLAGQDLAINLRASVGGLPLDYAMRREDKDTSMAIYMHCAVIFNFQGCIKKILNLAS